MLIYPLSTQDFIVDKLTELIQHTHQEELDDNADPIAIVSTTYDVDAIVQEFWDLLTAWLPDHLKLKAEGIYTENELTHAEHVDAQQIIEETIADTKIQLRADEKHRLARRIPVEKFRDNLGYYTNLAYYFGFSLTITRRNRPVALLTPIPCNK